MSKAQEGSQSDGSATLSALDIQVGGGHYKDCKIQPVEYIVANNLGYCEGAVIKYITRWQKKNGIEDLEKCKHYIDLIIQFEKQNAQDRQRKAEAAGEAAKSLGERLKYVVVPPAHNPLDY